MEEAEKFKKEGTTIFNESSDKTPDQLNRAREKYLKSSEKLLTRSTDFVQMETFKELYFEAMKSAMMNAAMMDLKLKEFQRSLDELKYAKQFFQDHDDKSKLDYRMAACYNGLGQHKDAFDVLEPIIKDSKDPLVKVEYHKAYKALKEEKEVTKSQKDTYAKMFNPDKRKEEQKKRQEEKQQKKEEDDEGKKSEEDSSLPKFLLGVATVGVIGLLAYKYLKR